MNKYNIGIEGIFFHIDFNEREYCPKKLIKEYGSARNFALTELMEE